MKIGVDEWCFHNSMMLRRMNLEDMIRTAGELGAQGIGFDYFMMTKADVLRTRTACSATLTRKPRRSIAR